MAGTKNGARLSSDAALHNPYFWYCLGLTLAFLAIRRSPAQIPVRPGSPVRHHGRADWRRCVNSRPTPTEVALEAIDKYNTHIELCNRAIEAEEAGLTTASAGARKTHSPQANPTKATEEVGSFRSATRRRLESEVAHNSAATTPDSPDGVASPSNKVGRQRTGQRPPQSLDSLLIRPGPSDQHPATATHR